jgi:DNA-binding NarL/FixJ family response regulator
VVDRSLLGRDSGQLISRLKAAHGHLQVIVLSGHGDALSVAGSRPRCL